ncbi:MAG: hypothetical protein K2X81_05350 [Candidatus Obscuribacterales bacterium]|nr:hypothetical protein [Candidatus Obscuribacterales bacterium]
MKRFPHVFAGSIFTFIALAIAPFAYSNDLAMNGTVGVGSVGSLSENRQNHIHKGSGVHSQIQSKKKGTLHAKPKSQTHNYAGYISPPESGNKSADPGNISNAQSPTSPASSSVNTVAPAEDATVILSMGGPSVRVNPWANYEAALNIFVNVVEIVGVLWGILQLAASIANLIKGAPFIKKMVFAFFLIAVGLGTPGCVNMMYSTTHHGGSSYFS